MHRTTVLLLLLLSFLTPALAEEDPAAEKGLPLDRVFQGKITSFDAKKGEIGIRYDFRDPRQMDDWAVIKPFRAAGDLEVAREDRQVRLKGSGCFVLKAAFTGFVSIEFDAVPWSDRDFGAIVAEEGQSDHFVLYSVNDLFFQKWDGGVEPGHMICRFGIIDHSEPKGSYAFRYVSRGTKPEITKYEKLSLYAEKDGPRDRFRIGEKHYKGKEQWREMPDQLVGPYVVKSQMLVGDIHVKGRLSPRWLKSSGVALRLEDPIEEEGELSEADRFAREKISKFEGGRLSAERILEVIEDASVSEEIREEAAEALIEAGDATIVTATVSLLYSADVVTRDLAGDVLKELMGKSFGFDAKADEERRSRAIRKMLEHIRKNPKRFGASR